MNNHYWYREVLKLLFFLGLCFSLRYVTGDWSLAIIVTLVIYFGMWVWLLRRLFRWLNSGMQDELMPQNYGVVGEIIRLIMQYKKNVDKNYKKQKATVKQFTDIIAAIPSATVILNKNNEVEWANYPALLLLGIDRHKDIGVNIQMLLRQSKFIKHLNKKSGREFEMLSPVDPSMTLVVQLAKYTPKKRLLLAHNISANIESQRSRRTFIANASHELRTPLTVIAGYLEFIQSDPSLPENLQTPVNKAIEQSGNMQVLINDLLVLSSLENKTLNVQQLTHIKLKEHLKVILKTLAASGETKGYEVISSVTDNLFIEAVEKELNSVCYNLIHNAIKYSERGTKIIVNWSAIDNQQVMFSVTDQGIGIAPEHIKHLSERFYRVDSGRSRRVGGTGLGLSIVKHIVERHQGKLEIHSRLGQGSTFSVILPVYPLGKKSKKTD